MKMRISCSLNLTLMDGMFPKGVDWSPANAGNVRDAVSIPGLGRSPEAGHGKPTPVILPGESHGQRSLAGYDP